MARLYLISDILHNSSRPSKKNYWTFKLFFQYQLPKIFTAFGAIFHSLNSKMILSIRNLLKIWKEWLIFDDNFLVGLEACFIPLDEIQKKTRDEDEYL